MQLATVRHEGQRRWGAVDEDRVRLAPPAGGLREFIESGESLPAMAGWQPVALEDVELDAPIPEPRRNIICLGLNYADHAAESQVLAPGEGDLPEHPVFFTKATTAVAAPGADIMLDERVTTHLDWEVELAFVIGRGGRFIAANRAMDHVFGYTVLNDLSARELQKRHRQFFLGKSMDGSAPMGPWITTAADIADPHRLDLSCTVNGAIKQNSNTRFLIFRLPRIIETLSNVMTLLPGDIIATGTPGGVGFARDPREFLRPGDVVECRIEGIGTITNRIVGPAEGTADR